MDIHGRNSAIFLIFLLYIYPFARPLPLEGQTAEGIWENKTRIIRFAGTGDASPGELTFVLKTWYGWYYDELSGYTWKYTPGEDGMLSGTLTVTYPDSRKSSVIPVYIGQNELYLDFLVRDTPPSSGEPLSGFWRAGGNANAIMIEAPRYSREAHGYYFTPTHMYRIHYWLTDMEYDPDTVAFIMDEGNEYEVVKFLRLAGNTYTCTTGRSRLVRNPEKIAYTRTQDTLILDNPGKPELPFHLSADGTILSFAEPWITRSAITDLENEISTHNGMRRPQRNPPLEFMELDFQWDTNSDSKN
ncbi:MAG: hypothetical protein LBR47_07135 [Spirochaetaceae bacterium]|jgi:hypothetical protein|nr:hypothetical protein [Spirochaetaceae bacterium]